MVNGQKKTLKNFKKNKLQKVNNVKKADVAETTSYSMRYNTKSILLRDI